MAAGILIIVITTIQDQQIVECKTTGRHAALPGQSFPYKSTLGGQRNMRP